MMLKNDIVEIQSRIDKGAVVDSLNEVAIRL
jgi:hypothetical protein